MLRASAGNASSPIRIVVAHRSCGPVAQARPVSGSGRSSRRDINEVGHEIHTGLLQAVGRHEPDKARRDADPGQLSAGAWTTRHPQAEGRSTGNRWPATDMGRVPGLTGICRRSPTRRGTQGRLPDTPDRRPEKRPTGSRSLSNGVLGEGTRSITLAQFSGRAAPAARLRRTRSTPEFRIAAPDQAATLFSPQKALRQGAVDGRNSTMHRAEPA